MPLGSDAQLALSDHRIHEKDERHAHFLKLRSEPVARAGVLRHVLKDLLDQALQRREFEALAARIAGDAVQHADVLK